MNIFKLLLLYGVINKFPVGPIKKATTPVTRSKIKSVRISCGFVFKVLSWLMYRHLHTPSEPPICAYGYYGRSNTITHRSGIDNYLQDICSTIPDWNIFTKLRDTPDIHETSVMGAYNPDSRTFENINKSYLNTVRLACGLGRLYSITNETIYREQYTRLLDGVDRMMKHTSYQHRIMTYPENIIGTPSTVLDLNAIAHLLDLISGFSQDPNTHTGHLEECVKNKLTDIMEYTDYVLTSDSIPLTMIDLAPNVIYNNTKCFIYTAIRICQGYLTKSDTCVFMSYLKMRPVTRHNNTATSLEDIITCAITLEAIITMCYDRTPSAFMSIGTHQMLIQHCVDWLDYFCLDIENGNPELESILANMHSCLNNNTTAEYMARDVASIVNVLYDNYVLRKTPAVRSDYLNKLEPSKRFSEDSVKLPLHRSNAEYYWTTSGVFSGYNDLEYPVFEYLTVYSRVYDLLSPLT